MRVELTFLSWNTWRKKSVQNYRGIRNQNYCVAFSHRKNYRVCTLTIGNLRYWMAIFSEISVRGVNNKWKQ